MRAPATTRLRPAGTGRRAECPSAPGRPSAAGLVVEPHRGVGAEQDLDHADLLEQPGRRPAGTALADTGARPREDGILERLQERLEQGPGSRRGRAWRRRCRGGACGARSPRAARRRRRSCLRAGPSVSSWPSSSCLTARLDPGCRRRRRPSCGSSASAALSLGLTGHLSSSASRSATRRRTAAASARAPGAAGAASRIAVSRMSAMRRCTARPSRASRSRGGRPRSAPRSGSRRTSGDATRASNSSITASIASGPSGTAARSSSSTRSRAGRVRLATGRGGSCQIVGTSVAPSVSSGSQAEQLPVALGMTRRAPGPVGDDRRPPPARAWRRSRARSRPPSCCGRRPGRGAPPRSSGGRPAVTCSIRLPRWARARQRRPGQASASGTSRSSNGRISTRPSTKGRGGRSRARRSRTGSSSRSIAPRRSRVSIRPTTRSSCSLLAIDRSRSSAGRALGPVMRWPPAPARPVHVGPSRWRRSANPRAA